MFGMFADIAVWLMQTLAPLWRVFFPSISVEDPKKMDIELRQALSGAALGTLKLDAGALVEDLRRLVTTRFHEVHFDDEAGTPQLQLLHRQRLLDDSECLREAGLSDGATIDIVLRRRQHFVVTASSDCTAKLWDIDDGGCFLTLKGHGGSVFMAKPAPDNLTVATCSQDGTVKLWQVASGGCRLTLDHGQPVVSVTFSPDGLLLATGTYDGTLRIWKVGTGECALTVQMRENSPLHAVDFSPDGKSVLTACGDGGTTHIWNVASGSCDLELDEQDELILSAHFAPDGRTIVMGCSDDTVQVWDLASKLCKQELEGHDGAVYSAKFSADGQFILTGSSDGTAKLWRRGDCVTSFEGHGSGVLSAVFSPDGDLIGTASADHTAKIWTAQNGQCTRTLEGHHAPIHSIEFSRA